MTLTTHGVAGACIGLIAYHNPALAVAMALISHPLLDTIPHWDYHLRTSHEDKDNAMNNDIQAGGIDFLIDLAKMGLDFGLGLLIPAIFLYVYHVSFGISLVVLLCALAGIVPDPLQFVYMKTRSRILKPIQEFHMYMHAHLRLSNRPLLGITSQVAIIAVLLMVMSRIV